MTDQDRDVDEFTRLKNQQDPRTIAEMVDADAYEDVVVERAHRHVDGRTTIEWDSLGTSVKGPEVKVGDTVRLYGPMFGERHGWALNGEIVEWKTPWERFAERVKWLADYDREKRERFAKHKDQLDKDYKTLPTPLQARIDRFRAEDPAFRIDSESYEMFICTEAAKFADAARSDVRRAEDCHAVSAFWKSRTLREKAACGSLKDSVFSDEPDSAETCWLLWAWALNTEAYGYDYNLQTKVLGAADGHSGNTFGGAMRLALCVLAGEEV